ncbi:hypothetical protein ccbrp13_46370 [Ktedonobacteria bacterium brp13]|nr:hypothetical protein ccbrp13_46370 [Ktedonobacteria bacterium brp13]
MKTTEQEPTTDIDQQLVRELKDGDIHPTTARIIELIGKNSRMTDEEIAQELDLKNAQIAHGWRVVAEETLNERKWK